MANEHDSMIVSRAVSEPPDRLIDYLLEHASQIRDDGTYWLVLLTAWVKAGTTERLADWSSLFQSRRRGRWKMMKKRDRAAWRRLPQIVTVYRAVAPGEDIDAAISWSLDPATLRRLYPGREIIRREVPKMDIAALTTRRGEAEIILLPISQKRTERRRMARQDPTPLRLYCRCGAAWLSTPMLLDTYAKMLKEFSKVHKGPEHGLCDAKTAAQARRRAEAMA